MKLQSIDNEAEAKEYILEGLRDKYGEEFTTDDDVEIIYTSTRKKSVLKYLIKEVYPIADPTKKFGASCMPHGGGVVDMRGEVIFQEDAEEFVSSTFGDDTQLLASYNVKIIMYGTTTVWREGASFEEFLDAGVIPPIIDIRLYIKSGASVQDCASQVNKCLQAMYNSEVRFEMRACYDGEDINRYPLILVNSAYDYYTFDNEAEVLEEILRWISHNEIMKEQQGVTE